jgi:glycine C-acetyltransferase
MNDLDSRLQGALEALRDQGLYKPERIVASPQGVEIETDGGRVLNFCANNYLGLANHPEIVAAAIEALKTRGYGMASVRFICGTQDVHKVLERAVADFMGMEDAILYTSCFDANTGLFETVLEAEDTVISDALNHASVIDGIRLCKAQRFRYAHSDMADLEAKLDEAKNLRTRLIVTDGVFSMDGDLAKLPEIVALAKRYDALVMVDDSHATGVLGDGGAGTAAHFGLIGQVDIVTSTLGKALGGASGGFTASRSTIVEWLRQRSRPYLFSNTLPPTLATGALKALELVWSGTALRARLRENARLFRSRMREAGFDLRPGEHPIVPVMLYDAALAQSMADELLTEGIYVIGFSHPVVPEGQARIRVQVTAAHTEEHLERAVEAFVQVGKRLGVLS